MTARRAEAIVFVVGAVLRLIPVFLPAVFVQKLVVDDALYYMEVAGNVATNGQSTFDGINATNGYHPLWLVVLLPFGRLEPSTLVLRSVLVLTAALAVATYILLRRLLLAHVGVKATTIGLALWWLSPMSIRTSVSATEANLAAMLFVITLVCAIRAARSPGVATFVALGSSGALLVLARTDAVFALLPVLGWLFLTQRRSRERASAAAWLALGGAGAILVAPWVLWNLDRFGTITQSSAYAVPVKNWEWMRLIHGGSSLATRVGQGVSAAVEYLGDGWPTQLVGSWPLLLGVVATALAAGTVRRSMRWPGPGTPWRALASLGAATLGGATVLAMFHAGARLFPREYYFEWGRLSFAIVVAALAELALARTDDYMRAEAEPRRVEQSMMAAVVWTAICVATWQVSASVATIADPELSWQPSMRQAAEWIDANVPPSESVLSFNAGAIGYFSDRTIINVDGAINSEAAEAIRAGKLATYMCESGATWYADFDPGVREDWAVRFGADADRLRFETVATIHAPSATRLGASDMIVARFSCVTG